MGRSFPQIDNNLIFVLF